MTSSDFKEYTDQLKTLHYLVNFHHTHAELEALDPDDRCMSEGASHLTRCFNRADRAIEFALSRYGNDRCVHVYNGRDELLDIICLETIEFPPTPDPFR